MRLRVLISNDDGIYSPGILTRVASRFGQIRIGEEEGTDRWAFAQRLVSITPLRLDLTDEKDLARVLALEPPRASGNKLPPAPRKSRKKAPREKAA